MDFSFDVVRTRTGDQLHTALVTRYEGKEPHTRSRTSCGCRVAAVIKRDVVVKAGLLCEKCFTPAFVERCSTNGLLNVRLF